MTSLSMLDVYEVVITVEPPDNAPSILLPVTTVLAADADGACSAGMVRLRELAPELNGVVHPDHLCVRVRAFRGGAPVVRLTPLASEATP